jgi:stearoyl-CoA desaturase (delta-9 desaturase)
MPRWKRAANLVALLNGVVALVWAGTMLWMGKVSHTDIYILVGAYLPIAFGITAGYHRLFAHRAYRTGRVTRYVIAALGAAAVQGPIIEWVSDHRKHHFYSDRPGDPHSPHVNYDGDERSYVAGLWNAHHGWLFRTQGLADPAILSPDLLRDPGICLIDRLNGVFVVIGFVVPCAVGYALSGGSGALSALMWGGFVRTALMHHVTFSVNSLCHVVGARSYRTGDSSRNLGLLALPTLGDAWHNNHHAFPMSAYHGLAWWQVDLTAMMIRLLGSIGLAWRITKPTLQQLNHKDYRGSGVTVN